MRKMKGRKRGEEKQRNEGHKGIKKRRKGQGRSASLVDVAVNDKETKNHNFNTGIKWRGNNNLSWLLLVSIKYWFQCVKDEKIRKTQIILLFQSFFHLDPGQIHTQKCLLSQLFHLQIDLTERKIWMQFCYYSRTHVYDKKFVRKQKLSEYF